MRASGEPYRGESRTHETEEGTPMAKKPTHYELTVNRPVEVDGIRFRPGARYQVKAAMYDAVRQAAPEAIASTGPLLKA